MQNDLKKLTDEELAVKYGFDSVESMKSFLAEVDLTEEEQIYRRGYCHGFLAARRHSDLTEKEVYQWRHSRDNSPPPGSYFDKTRYN